MDFEKKINDLRLRIRDLTSKKELQLAAHSKSENKLQLLKSDIEKMSGRIYDEYELTHTDAANLGYPEVTKENRARDSEPTERVEILDPRAWFGQRRCDRRVRRTEVEIRLRYGADE